MSSNPKVISETAYAKKRGDLMKLISTLRSIGAQVDLDLPRIICIGNQSAGKSSVVEAISQIRVPRDSGTCTRCLMECRLTSGANAWSATITLRIEFDSAGNRLHETTSYPFGPVITDPDAVELGLRRAQAAILNWGTHPYEDFLSMDEKTLLEGYPHNQLKFSKNTVCIAMSGPKLTDLVFIDLPGLIQNAEEDIIDLVEGTVTSQIEGNSIILVTLPMTDDLENQKAMLLARKQDPQGLRTIGVLTKPDMLTTGATRSLDAWLNVIEGRSCTLTHGYYCTRQPEDSDREKAISFHDARKAEAEFFRNTSPWSTSLQSHRFGTWNLTEKLSTLLLQKIDECLPKLEADVKAALDLTNTELAKLPAQLSNDPSSELMGLVTRFCSAFVAYVDGTSGSEGLIQHNIEAYITFKTTIRCLAPDFRPFATSSHETAVVLADVSEVLGDEPLSEQCRPHHLPMYLQELREHINRARTRELPNNIPFSAKVALIRRFTSAWESPVFKCFNAVQDQVSETLVQIIAGHFGRFSFLQSRVRALVADEIENTVKDTRQILTTLLKFERFPFTQNDHIYQIYRQKLLAHYRAARSGLLGTHEKLETSLVPKATTVTELPSFNFSSHSSPPSTVFSPPAFGPFKNDKASSLFAQGPSDAQKEANRNVPLLSQGKPSNSTIIPEQGLRYAPSSPLGVDSREHRKEALAALAKIGYNFQDSDLDKLAPSDPWEDELTVAAEIRSFYQVSCRRIIDNVPLTIDNVFFRSLAERMQSVLIAGLALGDKQKAAEYLAEDSRVVMKRNELMARKKRLESARQEILKLGS